MITEYKIFRGDLGQEIPFNHDAFTKYRKYVEDQETGSVTIELYNGANKFHPCRLNDGYYAIYHEQKHFGLDDDYVGRHRSWENRWRIDNTE